MDEVSIEVLRDVSLIPSLADAIGRTFERENTSVALGDTPEELHQWGVGIAPSFVPEGLSVVAVSGTDASRTVVGFAAVRDFHSSIVENNAHAPIEANVIEALLSRFFTLYLENHLAPHLRIDPPSACAQETDGGTPAHGGRNVAIDLDGQQLTSFPRLGSCAYLEFLGVLESHQRRGIAGRLVDHAIELARQRGYERLLVVTSSPGSQAIMKSPQRAARFQCLHAMPYAEFEFLGKRPFVSIIEPPSVNLYECHL